MNVYDKEDINTLARSNGFQIYLDGVRSQVRLWTRELVTNKSLTEGQRLGYQYATEAVAEGIKSFYEKAQVQMPDWLAKELLLDV